MHVMTGFKISCKFPKAPASFDARDRRIEAYRGRKTVTLVTCGANDGHRCLDIAAAAKLCRAPCFVDD